ncbi:MAG: TIGR01440 family protein [Acutalibacteraceae bacterium]
MYEEITKQSRDAVLEIIERAKLTKGDVFVVGCSSSTVAGEDIGTASSVDIAKAIFDGIYPELTKRGIFLAAQCCEHLNRAIITEKAVAVAQNREIVNVVPQPKAGGSFATTAYNTFNEPVAVEHIKADAGIDIGGVLIGMHLKEVAVPLTLKVKKIGSANITSARTRPKFIGGERAHYNDELK